MKMCPRTRNYIYGPFSNVATPHHNVGGAIYLPRRGSSGKSMRWAGKQFRLGLNFHGVTLNSQCISGT